MRKFALIVLIAILYANIVYSQCPGGDVTLSTQAQVDFFVKNYPDCSDIRENLKIGEYFTPNVSITDLTALRILKSISGSLYITNNNVLPSLKGLENLSSIGDAFIIENNDVLTDLSALRKLDTVSVRIQVKDNIALAKLDGLEKIRSLSGLSIVNNKVLTDISGLKNLKTIGSLTLDNNPALVDLSIFEKITSLPGGLSLINSYALTDLFAFKNLRSVGTLNINACRSLKNLKGLESLSSIEIYLSIYENSMINFEGIENLTSIGKSADIAHNSGLTNFKGLDNLKSIGESFSFYENRALKSLAGLENLTSIGGGLAISGEKIIDVSAIKNLTYIGESLYIGDTDVTNIDAFNKLTHIGRNFEISGNDRLVSLMGFRSLKHIGEELIINNNESLNFCNTDFLCNYLPYHYNLTIKYNAEGCDNASEILTNCRSSSKIKSKLFYDVNKNKSKDDNEPLVSFGSITIEPDGVNIIQNPTSGFGVFYVYDDTCTVTINETSIKDWTLTTDTKSQIVTVEDSTCVEVSFGISPDKMVSKMRAIIHAPNYTCKDIIPFYLNTKNAGTTITEGIVWLKFDAADRLFDFYDEPDRTIPPNQYGWYFDNLAPGNYLSKQINLLAPDAPNANLGMLLNYESFVEFKDQNGVHNSETFSESVELRCDFDANDQLVNPKRACDFILMEEDIFYTTRFQNIRWNAAPQINITNKIDTNLDLTTFRLINSSHIESLETSFRDNGTVLFKFNNINLPSSDPNLEDSQGYISYSIKAKAGLPENTIIKNSSTIYFGDNRTRTTNTVENVLVRELDENACNCPDSLLIAWCRDADKDGLGDPNKSIKSCIQPIGFVADCSDLSDLVGIEEEQHSDLINIYPNPSNGNFKIDVGNSNFRKATFSLYNSNGQLIVEPIPLNGLELGLDYPDLGNGIYYVQIKLDDLVLRKKLMVVK